MMRRVLHFLVAFTTVWSLCVFPALRVSSNAVDKVPKPGLRSPRTVSIDNSALKVYSSAGGRFILGTTGGDPDSPVDDNKRLLFGYPTDVGTSFATLRVGNGATYSDYRLGQVDWNSSGIPPVAPPITDGTSIITQYSQDGVGVEEKTYFAYNDSTGHYDTMAIQYTLTNNSGATRSVGLRLLLDIMVGNNDGAPYFIDGKGYVTHQSEWSGSDIPSYWISYESATFQSNSLKSQGKLMGGDATRPDRFVIADWTEATLTTWDYTVDPHKFVTNDSATVLYYNPTSLAPGQSRVLRTYYGITRAGGQQIAQLSGLEVTQAIQDLYGSVPLIQGKPTYVRAHVRSTLDTIHNVNAQLVGTRDGVPLPGSPLLPANVGGTLDALEYPDRQQLSQSFFFPLPTQWLSGTVHLELQGLDRVIGCRDVIGTPNDCQADVIFYPAPALDARMFGVTWQQGGVVHQPTQSDLDTASRQIAATFPIPGVDATFGGNVDATFLGGPPSSELDFMNINTMLEVNRILDGCITSGLEGCKTYYLGVLVDQPAGVVNSGMTAGAPPTFVSTAYVSDWLAQPHELAAAMGQLHTLCRGDEDQPTQLYPYADAKISNDATGDSAFYGFNVFTRLIYSPNSRDLMSHCLPRWPSDWTYMSIMNNLAAVYAESSPAIQAVPKTASGSVLVSGILTFTNDTGRFLATYVLPSNSGTTPAPGAYTIQFENSSGQTVASYPFVPNVNSENQNYGSFTMLLPWDDSTTRIVLLHGDRVIDSRGTSSHPPSVQVLSPNGGETLNGSSATVSWTASDADADPLSYIIQYSKDAGTTWQTLASAWKPMTYTMDLTRLPGSTQALVRVIANDGVYTGQDDSDGTFVVALHNPDVHIMSPENDTVIAGNQSVVLQGYATDVEDGQLADAALTWSSSLGGLLGIGQSLVLNSMDLPEGSQMLTLTAVDSDGLTSTASISVDVSRTQPPVPAHLDVAPAELQFTAVVNGGTTPWQAVSIDNGGDGTLNWSVSTSVPWLYVSAEEGVAPTNLLVAASPYGLAAGTHEASLIIAAAGASNSPLVVPVRFSILSGPPLTHSVFLPVVITP